MPDNTPSQPEFPVVRRGYAPDAVADYLVHLQRDFEDKVAATKARYANLELELAEAHKREEAVHLTLVAATKTKEELLVNAQRQADETLTQSREQADELLAEAKKEAFRLVADARQTSEEASSMAREEAKRIKAQAEENAEATRDAARREAVEMINKVESDTASLMAAHEAALVDMRRKYEEEEAELAARIEVLRATAADLDARLKAIASGTLHHMANNTAAAVAPAPAAETAAAPPAAVEPMPDAVVEPMAEVVDALPAEDALETPEPVAEEEAHQARPAIRPELLDEPVTADVPEAATLNTASEAEVTASVEEYDAPAAEVEEPVEDEDSFAYETAAEAPEMTDTVEETVDEPEIEEEPVPVPAAVVSYEDGDAEPSSPRKGSYYSRRSAKLPRIGTEAGRSALAAANAIRGATRGGPRSEAEDVTARTA